MAKKKYNKTKKLYKSFGLDDEVKRSGRRYRKQRQKSSNGLNKKRR